MKEKYKKFMWTFLWIIFLYTIVKDIGFLEMGGNKFVWSKYMMAVILGLLSAFFFRRENDQEVKKLNT